MMPQLWTFPDVGAASLLLPTKGHSSHTLPPLCRLFVPSDHELNISCFLLHIWSQQEQ